MFAALPAVAPAYRLFGEVTADPDHRDTLHLVSFLEQFPQDPLAGEVRAALSRQGVVVPERKGQLALALAGSTTEHYDALILAQQNEVIAWTRRGVGPVNRRSKKTKFHHVLRADDARETLASFAGMEEAFLCVNEFKGWRQLRLLTALNALFVDIDFHEADGSIPSLGIMKAVAEARINHLDRIGFALPSLVVYSGRGVHLYWSHNRVRQGELARWAEMQSWLQQTLDSDPKATDATRLMRLIGTVHGTTGTSVTAERSGPAYEFESLYQRYLVTTGQCKAPDIDALEEDEEARGPARAAVHDMAAYRTRVGQRPPVQSGIYGWFQLVYQDLHAIIAHHGWEGRVPEGQRNTLLFHLSVALSWFTSADALADEIARENQTLIGLPKGEAATNTSSVLRAAQATKAAQMDMATGTAPKVVMAKAREAQLRQTRRANVGEFRYGASRKRLWRDLSSLIPDDLIPSLRAIIPDHVWVERRREREQARNRVAEGRYASRNGDRREMLEQRRNLAFVLRSGGYSWDHVGAVLGVSSEAARKLGARH